MAQPLGPATIWDWKYGDGPYSVLYITSSLYPVVVYEDMQSAGVLYNVKSKVPNIFLENVESFGKIYSIVSTPIPIPVPYTNPDQEVESFGKIYSIVSTPIPIPVNYVHPDQELESFGMLKTITKLVEIPVPYTNWNPEDLESSGRLIGVTKS